MDKFFLTVFKILPCHEAFLVTTFLPLVLECSEEIILVFIKITGLANLVFYAGKEHNLLEITGHELTTLSA